MKNLVLLIVFMCFGTVTIAQNNYKETAVKILPQSQLTITGDTNISDFTCDFNPQMLPKRKAVSYSSREDQILFRNAVLVLVNEGFDCGNRQINKDFHSLLQTEEYPEIELEVKSIQLENEVDASAQVLISIAGKQKNYKVPIRVLSEPVTCFEGSLELDINDFGLEPPKKLFGMIKVREDIQINFNLSIDRSNL